MADNASRVADAMTISQLAEQTGIPPRRIRYYISEQLLPPPIGKGRASHYTRTHLDRLRQITAFREVNLSLDEIRSRLGQAEPDDRGATTEADAQPVRWSRYELVPGVEMHVREDLDQVTRDTARSMVDAVRHVLQHGNRDNGERNHVST